MKMQRGSDVTAPEPLRLAQGMGPAHPGRILTPFKVKNIAVRDLFSSRVHTGAVDVKV